jgi:hypothetical protein
VWCERYNNEKLFESGKKINTNLDAI